MPANVDKEDVEVEQGKWAAEDALRGGLGAAENWSPSLGKRATVLPMCATVFGVRAHVDEILGHGWEAGGREGTDQPLGGTMEAMHLRSHPSRDKGGHWHKRIAHREKLLGVHQCSRQRLSNVDVLEVVQLSNLSASRIVETLVHRAWT